MYPERLRIPAAMAMLAISLAGCAASSGKTTALALLPASAGASSASDDEETLFEALNGGIIGPIAGEQLSDRDRRRAIEAEYRALETAPVGRTISWTNERSGLSGEVSAAQAYQVGSQNCRQYTHTVTGKGQPLIARGTACRSDDGAWTPLT
ncbi:RT0821/Lpp0805 family surface protein [Pararhizobium haloflavum]|uniref:RT0821/Lpp0805 family surface protein n=1 Tax=Pararhizobium haloflavum TaxID=2037914 RepID=UPI000C17973D|nr:RT0821/Lpp0805 family surface protein [Pararhizobium haloflavum]